MKHKFITKFSLKIKTFRNVATKLVPVRTLIKQLLMTVKRSRFSVCFHGFSPLCYAFMISR